MRRIRKSRCRRSLSPRPASLSERPWATASPARRQGMRPGRRCSRARSRSRGSLSTARATCTCRSGEVRPDARSSGSTRRAAQSKPASSSRGSTHRATRPDSRSAPTAASTSPASGRRATRSEWSLPATPTRRAHRCDGLRDGDARRQRRRLRRGRQPLRLRRRHGPGARLPRRPGGGAATVLFRVPPMANSAGVGRQNQPCSRRSPALPRRRRGSSRTGWRSARTTSSTSPTPPAARSGESTWAGAATFARRQAATRRSRPTRSASTRSSCSTRPSTAPTGSRSTAPATSGSPRTSETRSSSSTAGAASPSSSAIRSSPTTCETGDRSSFRPVPSLLDDVLPYELRWQPAGQFAEHRRRGEAAEHRRRKGLVPRCQARKPRRAVAR